MGRNESERLRCHGHTARPAGAPEGRSVRAHKLGRGDHAARGRSSSKREASSSVATVQQRASSAAATHTPPAKRDSQRTPVTGTSSSQASGTGASLAELGGRSQHFVAGRVVHPGGVGVPGAVVVLLAPAQQGDTDASPIMDLGSRASEEHLFRSKHASFETGPDGAFHFDLTVPGPFRLRARAEGSQVFSPHFTPETLRGDLELVLPVPGSVRGRVVAPAGGN